MKNGARTRRKKTSSIFLHEVHLGVPKVMGGTPKTLDLVLTYPSEKNESVGMIIPNIWQNIK